MSVNTVSLAELILVVRNGLNTVQYDRQLDNNMLPITRIETISHGTIDFKRVKYVKVSEIEREKYQLMHGDILFSHINSPEHIGKTAIHHSDKALIHGVNLLVLRPNQHFCYPDYLNYYLKTFNVRSMFRARCKKAVNQASLNQDDILGLTVPIPPLPEQKRIATILKKADRLLQLRRYALELSGTYLQSVFLEMFGDPTMNPKHWPTGRLHQLCNKIVDCPHSTPIYSLTPTSYACIRSSDIQGGSVDWSVTKYVDNNEYQKRIQNYIPVPNDVVYCREGARFGNAAVIPDNKKVCLGQRMMLFRANSNIATPEFIWAFLESESTYKQADRIVSGSAAPHLNVGDIKEFITIIPPLPLQQEYTHIVKKYERLRAQQREAERQAEHLFQTLLHKAFQGELSSDEVEMQVPALEEEMQQASSFVSFAEPVDKDTYQLALQLD